MSIPNTNKTALANIPPPPIHERIIDNNRPSQALVRYLLEIGKRDSGVYDEIDRVINFANNIQKGAGLEEDGTYLPHALAKYISLATSLNNADLLLDSAIWDYTRELVTSVSGNASLSAIAQIVLVDASSGNISITMPPPSDCFDGNRSLRFAVHKIDISSNIVTILPNDSELIVGETSQSINSEGDIINFITDGTNWYLQS